MFFYIFVPMTLLPHMWDLSSQPGIEPVLLALEAQSPNHWTTREAPPMAFLKVSHVSIGSWHCA